METLKILPIGEIHRKDDWQTREIKFESGDPQYQATRTKPIVTWEVSVCGSKEAGEYLLNFFNSRKGQLEKFYCVIDGGKEVVRFASPSIEIEELRELQEIVACKCTFTFRRAKA